ncbi:glycosyltransferase family 87 protein [Acidocella sp.]|uniref:glycosyltransferase family 87 protein n=1 Tax=Acidocella sp. TaxID=50710 RepID=UPI002614D85E|nr:glycosyltransferase family 87 protein [Acidocella sp.]
MTRIGFYGGVAAEMLAWCALVVFWGLWVGVFVHYMAPRLGYFAHGALIGNDLPCGRPECDFSDFWRAGITARLSPDALHAMVLPLRPDALFALPGGYHEGFPYPPPILLLASIISHLPFEAGFLAWTIAWIVLAAGLWRWAGLSWLVIGASLLSPAALWNTMLGQLGLIGGALLVAGLMRGNELPGLAGALLGLLACKPQTGILVPAALGGQHSWRGVGGFALVCGLLVAMTVVAFGPSIWLAYLDHGQAGGATLLDAGFAPRTAQASGGSVFWMVRSLRGGTHLAGLVQLVVSGAVMAVTWWLWARARGVGRKSGVDSAAFAVGDPLWRHL